MNKIMVGFLITAISLLTTACGQSGGLYLPPPTDTHSTVTSSSR